MLGLQETQSTGSPKTYSCVACSAAFHSLASLLVHQASHASETAHRPDLAPPTCGSCGSLFASKDLLEKHHCVMLASPTQTCKCECGEAFSEFAALQDHRKQHQKENKVKSDLDRIPIMPDAKTKSRRPVSDHIFHRLLPSCTNERQLEESKPLSASHLHETQLEESAPISPSHSNEIQLEESAPISPSHLNETLLEESAPISPSHLNETLLEESAPISPSHLNETLLEESAPILPSHSNKKPLEESLSLSPFYSSETFLEKSTLCLPSQSAVKKLEHRAPPSSSADITMTVSSSDKEIDKQVQLLEKDSDTLKSSNVDENNSVHDDESAQESSEESTVIKKNSILTMVASAYMSHRQPVQMKQRNLPPRKVSPRAPIQPAVQIIIPKPKPMENQSNIKKDSVVSEKPGKKILSKRRKVISVTQTLCPVVVLETRQRLFSRDKMQGRHQCRICRRVFQDVDTLIMHHALHKKERVKFCLRCQQFVISIISVPENHVCYDTYSRSPKPMTGKLSQTLISPTPQQPEKLFYCSLCKRGYTKIRGLKRHHCPFKPSKKPLATVCNRIDATFQNLKECNRVIQNLKTSQTPKHQINVGVGTEPIKVEERDTEFPIDKQNHAGSKMLQKDGLNPQQTLTSFVNSKTSMPAKKVEIKMEEKDKGAEKQWTMPLDDGEIDVLIDVHQKNSEVKDVAEDGEGDNGDDVVLEDPPEAMEENSPRLSNDFNIHVTNKGMKRFVCIECHKSYSRRFSLKEHLKVCHAIKLKQQNAESTSFDTPAANKRFPCPQCDKVFSRKDNMNLHQRRCHPPKADPPVNTRPVESKEPASRESLFILSPSTEKQAVQPETTKNTSSSSKNWGIMSLPSVLPRRVTCECGSSFTCPRLLFEHLQQHAQESYICPHCGENLQSWMDFESHQQLHKSQKPANEQRPSQQQPHSCSQAPPPSTPAGQQQSASVSEPNPNPKPQQPSPLPPQNLNHGSFPDTLTCPKCKKHFSLRSSLLRHLRLCCGGDATGQKKHICTRCGAAFLNPLNLKDHIQSNTCKPAFKPIRCPVCVRWFSCVDGLKRHLVSHSRQAGLTCQICDQNCPTPQALEEHKRNVHGVNSQIMPAEDVQGSSPTPFQCHICLRNYPKLQSLKDHLRKVHHLRWSRQSNRGTVDAGRSSGPFQCQICARSYPDIKCLRNHRRRVHHVVGGAFQSFKGTEQNMVPSQFQCNMCPRSYADIQSLRDHRRKVHQIVGALALSRGIAQHNLFKCQICQRSYPDMMSLKNHRRRVHRILGPVPETSKSSSSITTTTMPTTTTIPTNDADEDVEEKPIPFLGNQVMNS